MSIFSKLPALVVATLALSERHTIGKAASCTMFQAPSRGSMWEQDGVLQRFVMMTVNRDKCLAGVVVAPDDDGTWVNDSAVCCMEHCSEITESGDIRQFEGSWLF